MDNFGKSVYNLINTNQGIFKSEKQKQFLTNQLSFVVDSGNIYGNSWYVEASFDDRGVSKLTKHTKTSTKVVYDRSTDGIKRTEAKTKKAQKSLKIASLNAEIASHRDTVKRTEDKICELALSGGLSPEVVSELTSAIELSNAEVFNLQNEIDLVLKS